MIYDSSSIVHRNIIFDAIVRGNNFEQRVYPSFVNFIDFIEKQNGKYVLTYGTLLGCIRDNKRTLWDDEFDIFMFEKDMNVFHNCVPSLHLRPFYYSPFITPPEGGVSNVRRCIPEKDIIYKINYGFYNYIITKNKNDFYQVWNVNIINNQILNKVTDIFYEKYYHKYKKPYYNSITTEFFNGRLYNIPLNYHEILVSSYGNNYINEYVCFNHIIASCYLDKNKDKYLIITTDDYNSFVNMLLLRSEQKSLLLSELKNKFITTLKN